jgi:hypothetical protein
MKKPFVIQFQALYEACWKLKSAEALVYGDKLGIFPVPAAYYSHMITVSGAAGVSVSLLKKVIKAREYSFISLN